MNIQAICRRIQDLNNTKVILGSFYQYKELHLLYKKAAYANWKHEESTCADGILQMMEWKES